MDKIRNLHKGSYLKLCGQVFASKTSLWYGELYIDIIKPMGKKAKKLR